MPIAVAFEVHAGEQRVEAVPIEGAAERHSLLLPLCRIDGAIEIDGDALDPLRAAMSGDPSAARERR